MEVSGKHKTEQSFSASCGSAEDFLLFCIPCDRDGVRVSAKGYCTTCKEHLCEACYKHHRKSAPSRHHVLLDQDSMPITPSVPNSQDDFDNCDDHGDEKLKFYCRDHDIIVCSICVTLDHRVCKVEYIPKLSTYILEGEELNELLAEMKYLEKVCKSRIKKARDEMKAITQNHDEIIREIHQFRKEINTYLDKMENRLVKEAKSLFDKQQMTIKKLSKDVEDIKEEMTQKQAYLDNMIQNNCINKLFVEMKEAKKQLQEMKAQEKQLFREIDLNIVSFIKNSALVNMLEEKQQLGELVSMKKSINKNVVGQKDTSTPSENKTLSLEVVDDIDMNSSTLDKEECNILGMEVIQSDKIVVCDWNNRKVKYYDTVQKRIISEIQLINSPYNVAAITDSKVVVTVPNDRSINFMSLTNGRISSDCELNINERCYGIAYSRDQLVVSCNYKPGSILVLDLQGKIMQRFSEDSSLFCAPGYITVNTAGTAIYVSDCSYDVQAVKQLDWQGNVINTYKPAQGGDVLRGICELNDGTFLICLQLDGEDNLQRLSNTCKPCKIMRKEKLDSWYPRAVAYCKTTRKLFVSYSKGYGNNCLKVFKVEWSLIGMKILCEVPKNKMFEKI